MSGMDREQSSAAMTNDTMTKAKNQRLSGERQVHARFSLWEFATNYRSTRHQPEQPPLKDPTGDGSEPGPVTAERSIDERNLSEPMHVTEDLSLTRSTSQPSGATEQSVRSLEEFRSIVEDVRAYLIDHRARTEEEQIAYGTALNRAVLGHTRERQAFMAMIQDRLAARQLHQMRPISSQYETMAEAVFAEVIGLNVLESVLRDKDDLEEVQVLGTRIYEVRNGRATISAYRFRSVEEVERLQQNLVLFNRDTINTRKRWAEVSLPDGARVTMTGFGYTREPTITIRFFPLREASLASLVGHPYETIDDRVASLLEAIIAAKFNLVIIGPTNSGKSHLLKAIISEISDEQRIVTIEQRSELHLHKLFPDKNIVEFEAPDEDSLHNAEQAFRLALRQSPERIVLAEIRDQEANLYVRACTRGHMGSMTTAHVNTLEDVPDAVADMCMLDRRGMNPERLRRRIAQFVTQIGIEMRVVNGQRKIVRIGEITEQNGRIIVHDLVLYDTASRAWQQVQPLSEQFSQWVRNRCPERCEALQRKGWLHD